MWITNYYWIIAKFLENKKVHKLESFVERIEVRSSQLQLRQNVTNDELCYFFAKIKAIMNQQVEVFFCHIFNYYLD
jgi:hypothetical protein